MDSTLIVSVVIAVVAIVPGIWALVNQANKDKNQSKIDMNLAAQNAAMNIISPLQTEVTRLQNRVGELEIALIAKTNEIGVLMQANIDKDAQIRTLKYTMEGMQLRLNTFEGKRKSNDVSEAIKEKRKKEDADLVKLREEEDSKVDEIKKEKIKTATAKTIERISNGSFVNNQNNEMEE